MMNGSQVEFGAVASFPSVSASRIAVTGRQKGYFSFAYQAPMSPSATLMLTAASSRAVSTRSSPRAVTWSRSA
jgi:hypothetical protein